MFQAVAMIPTLLKMVQQEISQLLMMEEIMMLMQAKSIGSTPAVAWVITISI